MNLPEPKPRLIVNTMGWIQGLGLTLLLEQILLVRPELIIQLHFGESSSNRTNSVDLSDSALKTIDTWNSRDISNEIFTHDVLLIESKAKSSSHHAIIDPRCHLGPPDHRDLTMLTYFMSTLSNAPTSLPSRLMHEPLGHPVAHVLDCIPYQVPVICSSKQQDICGNNTVDDRDCSMFNNRISVSSANQSVLHTTHSSLCSDKKDQIQLAFRVLKPKSKIFKEDSSPFLSNVDDLLSCLNATLVALCVVPQDIIKEPDSTCLYRWISCNPVCECVGLAVCRAIDPVAGVLYLTTGVPEENLLKVTGILRGNVNLPNCFFLDQPFFRTKIDNEACILPYLGPSSTKGKGRVGLPSRRSYPKTMHHDSHRIGTSETIE
ncbi:unnamed protein product [Heterobilharzia americana]|nr:unnamed protein product [Heterobilharzia americana]